jgi:hypothetical protein
MLLPEGGLCIVEQKRALDRLSCERIVRAEAHNYMRGSTIARME